MKKSLFENNSLTYREENGRIKDESKKLSKISALRYLKLVLSQPLCNCSRVLQCCFLKPYLNDLRR